MLETKNILYGSYELRSQYFIENKDTLSFTLLLHQQNGEEPVLVFNCMLKSLHNHEAGFLEGEYYQSHIDRLEEANIIESGTSLTKIFHEIVKTNKNEFPFIRNIYSSSLNNGDGFSEAANSFWEKQVENNLAELDEGKGRYRVILE